MPTPRLLATEEVERQLADLPGVHTGRVGTLTLAVRAPSFAAAARFVALVADEAEQMDHHPDVDLRWRTVTCTLSTHSAGGVTQFDVELAHRIVAAAAAVGAEPAPAPEHVEVALDCRDPERVRPFWAAGLGYTEQRTPSGGAELQDPAGRGPVLWFQRMDPAAEPPGSPGRVAPRGRFHLDVYVPDDAAEARVAACLAAGGTLVSDEHAPGWWVLADPEGNELCVCTRLPQPAVRP
jgi:4a-hydroxytetrahydrobiopterin dehydratase